MLKLYLNTTGKKAELKRLKQYIENRQTCIEKTKSLKRKNQTARILYKKKRIETK